MSICRLFTMVSNPQTARESKLTSQVDTFIMPNPLNGVIRIELPFLVLIPSGAFVHLKWCTVDIFSAY
jgi:hypothetical protein